MSNRRRQTPLRHRLIVRARMGLAILILPLCVASASSAQATFDVVKSFDASYPDGASPTGALIQAADGRFYGTTYDGGRFGHGTIFSIDAAGTLTTLHHFSGDDGSGPNAGLIQAQDGSFYGITESGGAFDAGSVFHLDTSGTLTTFYHFAGPALGGPSSLIQATDGSFYGTLPRDGNSGQIFRIDATTGVLSVLYRFTGRASDGGLPQTLMQAADGSFYGTSAYEASNGTFPGTVFRLDAAGSLTTLHRFSRDDAYEPSSGLIEASDGYFYGTAAFDVINLRTVYRINAAGVLTTLLRFNRPDVLRPGIIAGADGFLYAARQNAASLAVFRLEGAGSPLMPSGATSRSDAGWPGTGGSAGTPIQTRNRGGKFIQALDGTFYGATSTDIVRGDATAHTIFTLDAVGARTTFYRFSPGGGSVVGGVFARPDGSLFGTTTTGSGEIDGSIFTLDPAGTLTTLHRFSGSSSLAPQLAQGPDGSLYGVTGGSLPPTIVKFDLAGGLTPLYAFAASPGAVKGLTAGAAGTVYGISGEALCCRGSVFSLAPSGTLTPLFRFTTQPQSVVEAKDGTLYGIAGGVGGEPGVAWVVYRLDPGGAMTELHRQPTSNSNIPPVAPLIQGADGALYGTTPGSNPPAGPATPGTIFRVEPTGGLTTLHEFAAVAGGTDVSPLTQAADGSFYGTTSSGGAFGGGTVFRLDPAGRFTTVHDFNLADGTRPLFGVVQGADGRLYGTTSQGGPRGGGTIFRLATPANQIPVAHPQSIVTAEDTAINLQLTGEDADGDALAYAVVTAPEHGVLAGVAPHLTYTPAANYFGADSFTFTVNDGTASSAPATVTITVTPVDDPPGPGPAVHAVPGHIEAEDYDAGGPGVGYFDTTPGNLGDAAYRADDVDLKHSREGGFAIGWLEAGEWLAYTLDVAQDGRYTIQTRVGSLLPDRTFHFEIDGRPVTGAIPVPQLADWDLYKTVSVPAVPLQAGAHVLRVVMGPLDYMDLQSFDIVPDAPVRSVPGRIEAEDYDGGGPGVGYFDVTPGNEGGAWRVDDVDLKPSRDGGVTVGWMNAGEWLAYTVDVARAGVYTLQAHVGSIYPGRTFHVEVDGQDVTGSLAVPVFADWDLYGTVQAPGVLLSAGRHVLRVVVGPEDYLDLDALIIAADPWQGQATLRVLATFDSSLEGPPVQSADGSFYGTTPDGGAFGYGSIYKIDAAGTLTTVHSFNLSDGRSPGSGLVVAADGFYGTAVGGGAFGGGTVFRFDPAGVLTTIHHFYGGGEEVSPLGGQWPNSLVQAADGTLYGTTSTGGLKGQQLFNDCNCGNGTVFAIDAARTMLLTLYRFPGGNGGGHPNSLRQAADGSLYGVTDAYPNVVPATIFRTDTSGQLTTLARAGNPIYGVIQASDGHFYSWDAFAVYRIDAAGTLTTFYRFEQGVGSPSGLIEGADGFLYGTTGGFGSAHRGMVFRLDSSGTLTEIYRFTDGDGRSPAALRQAIDGSLYGTMLEPTPSGVRPRPMLFRLIPAN